MEVRHIGAAPDDLEGAAHPVIRVRLRVVAELFEAGLPGLRPGCHLPLDEFKILPTVQQARVREWFRLRPRRDCARQAKPDEEKARNGASRPTSMTEQSVHGDKVYEIEAGVSSIRGGSFFAGTVGASAVSDGLVGSLSGLGSCGSLTHGSLRTIPRAGRSVGRSARTSHGSRG